MRIFKSSLITTLIAGLLLSAIPLQDAFAQRGGGNRGGGGGRSAGGGGGGNRGGGDGQRSFSGGQGRSGGRSDMNRGPAGPSRSDGNRRSDQGQRGNNQVNRGDGQRSRDTGRTVDGNRDPRSFTERNFDGDRSRTSNYRGERDGNRSGDFNRGGNNRNRNDFDRGRYTDFNRGNFNRNDWNSAFFGPRGAFGNGYLGRGGLNYGNYGRGFGYGGWNGYGGYGLGYGRYGGYGFLPFLGGLGLGYGLGGYGLGYGGYGLGYGAFGPAYGGYYSPNYVQTVPQTITSDAQPAPPPADTANADGADFALMGEAEFRAGNYQAAMMAFRHALVDEPNNAGLMLLISQCLFQMGQWMEAAGATQLAMGGLPEDKWGTVVENYTQLYGNIEDYTRQLKELENAVKQDPENPALRFLVGYHFGYLNYPQQAVRELGKAVELEGRDPAARRLHDIFAAKIGAPTVGPVPESLAPDSGNPSPANQPGTE